MSNGKFERNMYGQPRYRVLPQNGKCAVYDYKLLDIVNLDGKWFIFDDWSHAMKIAKTLNDSENTNLQEVAHE